MKNFLTILNIFLFLGDVSLAAVWSRVDEKTIKMLGSIEEDEITRFNEIISNQDKTLIIDSSGGETMAGIQIGREVHRRKLTVVVENQCHSSCANYVFPAAQRKVIRHGIIGYHGNMKSCFGSESGKAEAANSLRTQGVAESVIQDYLDRLDNQIAVETEFLESIGVSQELFYRSCRPDKGMNDGKTYSLLLPTNETFQKYGIGNIEGEQSRDLTEGSDFVVIN